MPTAAALLADLRRICLALPEAHEGLTHGGETWFVRRRSFAKFVDPEQHRLEERSIAFWAAAAPGVRDELTAADPDRYFRPRFGGRDWVGMRLDPEPDWAEVREIVTDAYRVQAPQKLVTRLEAPPT